VKVNVNMWGQEERGRVVNVMMVKWNWVWRCLWSSEREM
jgi:hypothetical protein